MLEVRSDAKDILDIRIKDRDKMRYELPKNLTGMKDLYRDVEDPADITLGEETSYEVTVKEEPFSITVTRKDTQEDIFNTEGHEFIYTDNYLQLVTKLCSPNIFGMGERNTKSLRLKEGEYTLYGRDDPSLIETNRKGNNVYGSHPMILQREKSSNYHVLFLKNSAAMDVAVDKSTFTYKIVTI